jgi:hypothetical protein
LHEITRRLTGYAASVAIRPDPNLTIMTAWRGRTTLEYRRNGAAHVKSNYRTNISTKFADKNHFTARAGSRTLINSK